jgi:putative phage-type endonuclease
MLTNQDFTVNRQSFLGGSDIASLLGISPYKSPIDLWQEKTGKVTGNKEGIHLRYGTFMESFVASEYEKATGYTIKECPQGFEHPTHSFILSHIDRLVDTHSNDKKESCASAQSDRILECKTASVFNQHQWGEIGSDVIPPSYLAQVMTYMSTVNLNQADVAVLLGNQDFRIYSVMRDRDLEKIILQKAHYFWTEYVLKDIPPPPQNEADCLNLFNKGDSSKSIEACQQTHELALRLQEISKEIDQREKEISHIKQAVMLEMKEAEVLTYKGQILATWKAPKPSFRLDGKRLEIEHPDIANNYKLPIQNNRRLIIKELSA